MVDLNCSFPVEQLGVKHFEKLMPVLNKWLDSDYDAEEASRFKAFASEKNFHRAIGMGLRLGGRFRLFAPVHFYMGCHYLLHGDREYAREQFERAQECLAFWDGFSANAGGEHERRKKFFAVMNARAMVMTLEPDQKAEYLRQLRVIEENGSGNDWNDRLFAAVHYARIGAVDIAVRLLNTDMAGCVGEGHARSVREKIRNGTWDDSLIRGLAPPARSAPPSPEQAVGINDAETLYQLGELHLDLNHAREFYLRAAEKGHLLAYANLALISPEKYRERIPGILAALEKNAKDDFEAAALAADFHMDNGTVEFDLDKAVKLLSPGVKAGNGRSIAMLGLCHLHSAGADDQEKAYELLKTAWEKGEFASGYYYALCLLAGIGGPLDIDLGLGILFEQARLGSPAAAVALGNQALKGNLLPYDENLAFSCFSMAANQGNAAAMHALGLCCLNGLGTPKDEKTAFELFSDSAGRQYDPGIFELALCLANGIGTAKNPERAVAMLTALSEKGYIPACKLLGQYYQYGIGVNADYDQARELYATAAGAGDQEAISLLKSLEAARSGRAGA